MRDPEGVLRLEDERVVRTPRDRSVNISDHFLTTTTARELVAADLLMPYEFIENGEISSPRIKFVSYPTEWCDGQLRAAADLTLAISRKILVSGHELKDASAWNIIFEGSKPVFCDHFSFQTINTVQWWAFGQFVRHFCLPLAASQLRDIRPADVFKFSMDGLPTDRSRKILGAKAYLSRVWPLLITRAENLGTIATIKTSSSKKNLHSNLFNFLEFTLGKSDLQIGKNHWKSYADNRTHYSASGILKKRDCITSWLSLVKANWVIDFGCNTGEYTHIASEQGSNVIAIDNDHDCINTLYFASKNNKRIYPVFADISQLSGGYGWCGNERAGLLDRLHGIADMVLVLALLHHLAISESIPVSKIAELVASLTSRYAIVELIASEDPLVVRLAQQRNRSSEDFSFESQRDALLKYFRIEDSFMIPDSARQLVLLRKL